MSISTELYLIMNSPGTIYIVLFAFFVTIYLVYARYRNELRDIPGPFLASILPLDRILSTAKGHQFATHIGYHQKYGPLVRIGPNHVSLSDAEAIPLVYSISTKFFKVSSPRYYRLHTWNLSQHRAISIASSTPNRQRVIFRLSSQFATKRPTARSRDPSQMPIRCPRW